MAHPSLPHQPLIMVSVYPSVFCCTSVSCLMLSGWDAMSSAFPLNPLPHSLQLPQWHPSTFCHSAQHWLLPLLFAAEIGPLHWKSFETTSPLILSLLWPSSWPASIIPWKGAVLCKCSTGRRYQLLQSLLLPCHSCI